MSNTVFPVTKTERQMKVNFEEWVTVLITPAGSQNDLRIRPVLGDP